jgi:hypothetical protein
MVGENVLLQFVFNECKLTIGKLNFKSDQDHISVTFSYIHLSENNLINMISIINNFLNNNLNNNSIRSGRLFL